MPKGIKDLKPGMTISLNNELYLVLSCEHSKIARGSAFLRTKLKNLNTSAVLEKTLRDSDNIEEAFIEKRKIQFLYKEAQFFHFMDLETYEDLIISEEKIKEEANWLKENLELTGIFFQSKLISLELPSSLELKVTETEPGFRGDTVKSGTKPAKLETGVTIQVPLFIRPGDIIKVNPQTGEYISRG